MRISEKIIKYAIPHPIFKIMGNNVGNGCYLIPYKNYKIFVQASDGAGWDHVSVSLYSNHRPPNWEEMCFIKDLFFSDDETVVQFHPKKSEYVNFAKNCLHLWRSHKGHELPDSFLVGPK